MHRVLKVISTPAARSSAIYYFGNFILSFSRYIFHLILLRLLAPPEYGEFLSYLSLTNLISVPMGTVATVVTKFVSDYRGKDDKVAINQFFYFLLKKLFPLVIVLGVLLIAMSSPLAVLFKAHSMAFVVLGISIVISLFQSIINSYIAAFQRFIFQTIVGFGNVVLTILLSVLFIKMGMGPTGAVVGQLLAGVVASLLLFLNIRHSIMPKITDKPQRKFELTGFMGYSFIFALGTASLISTDVLVVRALFDSHTSGLYSSLSILGRMILFALTPFCALILPIASHRHAKNSSTQSVFLKLGAFILLFGTIGASLFSLFPKLVISVLSGSAYLEAAPLLPYVAFSMALLAFSEFIISYLMATGRPRANIFLLTTTILQPFVFWIFKNTFSGAVIANFVLEIMLFLCLTIYLFSGKFSHSKHI